MALMKHNVYVGSETGIFKGVNTFKDAFDNLNTLSELSKEKGVNVMCWKNKKQTQMCMGLRNGTVYVFDTESGQITKTYNFNNENKRYVGIGICERKLITCLENGAVTVWNKSNAVKTFSSGKKVTRMRQNPNDPKILLTGGEENELKIWDLNDTAKPIFEAKNVKNDFLGLRVPVWVTDMGYLHDGRRIVITTRHHHIRVYDPLSGQRRPVIDATVEEYPFTSMAVAPLREDCIITGSSHGRMLLFDTRKKSVVKRYKGFSGSVQDIVCHPTQPIVASCSIDRFLRVHDVNTAQLMSKVYLKSRVSCLLVRDDYFKVEVKRENPDAENEEVEDFDELWESMPTIVDKTKRKSKNNKTEINKKKICKIIKTEA